LDRLCVRMNIILFAQNFTASIDIIIIIYISFYYYKNFLWETHTITHTFTILLSTTALQKSCT